MATPYPKEEEVKPLIQCQTLPLLCEFLGEAKLQSQCWNPPPWWISRERTCFRSHTGTSLLSQAPGRGQNCIPEPTSSIGSQGRNVPFKEDVVESTIRTSVSVANDHPLVPLPLETVDVNECPFFRNSP